MNSISPRFSVTVPLQVGLVGTGYAAKLRAETLQADPRANLICVAGHTAETTQAFSQRFEVSSADSWQDLVQQPHLDLVMIATVNRDHAPIARAALQADKHVVVEYPLALDVTEAKDLIALAAARNKLLHVEHIELLGGVHQALKASLPQIGTPFYARYATINPQRPAPEKWTYQTDLFGFPLVGALSRLHRLVDAFGPVATVSCHSRFWYSDQSAAPWSQYVACLCTAHLRFQTGLLAEVVYGKGETLWRSERMLEVHGGQGALIFNGDQGSLVREQGSEAIAVGSRRGLFSKDTAQVLAHLTTGAPLYVTAEASLYTLRVADAARRSAESGQPVEVG